MQGDVGPHGKVEEEAELRETEGQRVRCKMALTPTWGRPAAQTKLTQKHTPSSHSPLCFPPKGLPSGESPGSWNCRRNLPEGSSSTSVAKSFPALGIQMHS